MSGRTWQFTVQDARGRRRRGAVTFADVPPSPIGPLPSGAEFAILLLGSDPGNVTAPERTAICVPGVPKIRLINDAPQTLPRSLGELTFNPQRMAAYVAGRIEAPFGVSVELPEIFPPHSDRPRLDRLALVLLEVADAESVAPYVALIRTELQLRPQTDALDELGLRLMPDDPKERPPARAPGIVRLAKAIRRLRGDEPPEIPLEQMAEDLRFLKLFEKSDWDPAGLDRLLQDVGPVAPAAARKRKGARPSNVVRLRPGRRARPSGRTPPAGDA